LLRSPLVPPLPALLHRAGYVRRRHPGARPGSAPSPAAARRPALLPDLFSGSRLLSLGGRRPARPAVLPYLVAGHRGEVLPGLAVARLRPVARRPRPPPGRGPGPDRDVRPAAHRPAPGRSRPQGHRPVPVVVLPHPRRLRAGAAPGRPALVRAPALAGH